MQTTTRYYTPEEYLSLEEKAENKSEYRDGKIVAMSANTTNHNHILGNLAVALHFALRKKNYHVYIIGLRLWIPRYRQYNYPDIMVIQGENIYTDKTKTAVMNPLLIVEVLSKSTENYDQGKKFLYYRSIPEFKEYILIEQYRYHVMQYVKTDDGKWILTELESESDVLKLQTVDFEIPFTDLYEQVDFTQVSEE
ncbi:MAG TPA: Uma2 family endonuclease [Nostocaceae cyanobacterium]|nr:Uma2 family endonuclease [Nostocaceae cyanobacterium]